MGNSAVQLATSVGPVVAVVQVTKGFGFDGVGHDDSGANAQSSVLASHDVVCEVDLRICVDVVVIWVVLREACEVLASACVVDRVVCVVERKFWVEVSKFCVVLRKVCAVLAVICAEDRVVWLVLRSGCDVAILRLVTVRVG
jgi:hypothetical protein